MSSESFNASTNLTASVQMVTPAKTTAPARSVRGWSPMDVHGIALPVSEHVRITAVEDRLRALGPMCTAARQLNDNGPGAGLQHGQSRLWCERLDSPRNCSTAQVWREREMTRQMAAGSGPTPRGVLVEYSDGRDLVLVARRSDFGRHSLLALARWLVDVARPSPDVMEMAGRSSHEPDINLESEVYDTYGPLLLALSVEGQSPHPSGRTHRFVLDSDVIDSTGAEAAIVAALGLTLSRYCDRQNVLLGVAFTGEGLTDGPEGLAMVPMRIDSTVPVNGLIAETVDALHRFRACYLHDELRNRLVPQGGWLDTVALLVDSPSLSAEGSAEVQYAARCPDGFPLSLHVSRRYDGTALVAVCHVEHLVTPTQVESFCRHFVHVYRQISSGVRDAAVAAVELMPASEQLDILSCGDGGPARPASWATIPEAIAAQAASRPEAPAVTDGDVTVTYEQLERRSKRISAVLGAMGVRPGARVGVCLPRSINLVATLLGVLKAGAAYVPMDPKYPEERLRFTAQDAALALVIGDSSFPSVPGLRLVRWEELLAESPSVDDVAGASTTPDDPAYVIFTSGSTGRPKGVVVPHRNVVDLLSATAADFSLGPADTWTFFHSVAFDFSVWEMWGCLMSGGRLVVVPDLVARAPEDFYRLLANERVTVLSQTPTAFGQLTAVLADPTELALRLVIFGGEPLDARSLIHWFDICGDEELRMVNMYGITETTVHVTAERMRRRHALTSSRVVGRPLAGWSVSVRDVEGRVKPLGVPGEVWVGGSGVARGYLNRPELTAERFICDPITGRRIYRSGDLGRMLAGGRLEHLGRIDHQVKIRGHRIELDEVREVYLEIPSVLAAAVIVRPYRGDHGDLRLHAYVVPDGPISSSELREQVARLLPDYMVPATTTCLSSLPLTVNGKLDVDALPEPRACARTTTVGAAHIPIEILRVWDDLFGTAVSLEDNFFELGGNSLLATRMSAQLQALGLPRLPIRQLYRQPTPRGVAAYYRASVDSSTPQ